MYPRASRANHGLGGSIRFLENIKDKYSSKNEVVAQHLRKDFASAKMTEKDVGEYIDR